MGGKVVMASWVFILWLVVLMGFAVAIPIAAKWNSPNAVESRAKTLLFERPDLLHRQLGQMIEDTKPRSRRAIRFCSMRTRRLLHLRRQTGR
jgi:hypothetical protein